MKALIFTFVLFAATPVEDEQKPDCIPEGDSALIEFALPDFTSPGMPKGATLHSAEAYELDPFWSDPMGSAFVDESSVTVPIENKGGSLSGPSGESQNGGSEGDCIEVWVSYTIRFQVELQGLTVWASFTWGEPTDAKGVCPCRD